MVDAKLITRLEFDRACEVAKTEILVRLCLGDRPGWLTLSAWSGCWRLRSKFADTGHRKNFSIFGSRAARKLVAAIYAFVCKCCGKIHEGSPSIAFDAPWHYSCLTDDEKKALAKLSSDFCKIAYDDRTDYFIRTVLEVPIHGHDDPFTWGVWVSLSGKSFARYVETFDTPVAGEGYFGWLCNRLPWYADTIALPSDVIVQAGRRRPFLRLHGASRAEHALVRDSLEGISASKAQEIAELALHSRGVTLT